MTLQAKVKKHPRCAIFSRNYTSHLKEAVNECKDNPERLITFRASIPWKSAQIAVNIHGPRKIYFAPVDGKGLVMYEAVLEQVELNPEPNTKATEKLLENSLPSIRHEGLWEKDGKIWAKTLYVISHCQKIPSPFHITELKKLADDKQIDENFNYSYAIVYQRATE
jgi:hypothetical protein